MMTKKAHNPPYCPKCGASAQEAFVQIGDEESRQPTPFGICRSCFEMVKLIPLPDNQVAPFLEVVPHLIAPPALIQARTQIRMQIGSMS